MSISAFCLLQWSLFSSLVQRCLLRRYNLPKICRQAPSRSWFAPIEEGKWGSGVPESPARVNALSRSVAFECSLCCLNNQRRFEDRPRHTRGTTPCSSICCLRSATSAEGCTRPRWRATTCRRTRMSRTTAAATRRTRARPSWPSRPPWTTTPGTSWPRRWGRRRPGRRGPPPGGPWRTGPERRRCPPPPRFSPVLVSLSGLFRLWAARSWGLPSLPASLGPPGMDFLRVLVF